MRRFLILGLLLACVGCDKSDKGSDVTLAQGDLSGEEKTMVVARIGDRTITLEEFEARLGQQSNFGRARYNSADRRREFLEELVRFELIAMEAERKGYADHPDVQLVQKQAMVRRFTTKELGQLVKMKDIDEAAVRAYFDTHQDDYSRPDRIRASHILVGDETVAKALYLELKAKLEAEPKKALALFAEYAKKHSKDTASAGQGGDLLYFGKPGESHVKRPQSAPPISRTVALAAYDIGAVGALAPAPIKTPTGWHIVQKTGIKRAYKRDFASVRRTIQNKLFHQKKGDAMDTFMAELRKKTKVDIDDAVLAQVKETAPKGPPPNLMPPIPGRPGTQTAPKVQGGRP